MRAFWKKNLTTNTEKFKAYWRKYCLENVTRAKRAAAAREARTPDKTSHKKPTKQLQEIWVGTKATTRLLSPNQGKSGKYSRPEWSWEDHQEHPPASKPVFKGRIFENALQHRNSSSATHCSTYEPCWMRWNRTKGRSAAEPKTSRSPLRRIETQPPTDLERKTSLPSTISKK